MIKVEKIEVWGFEHAIRGMRNPMNSWDKSDSMGSGIMINGEYSFIVGENDLGLMQRLYAAGHPHRKYLRQIMVSMDITAPLYWWKEFDTYKVGTTANSCSTMHKIMSKPFELDDFSHEHVWDLEDHVTQNIALNWWNDLINGLNYWRNKYLIARKIDDILDGDDNETLPPAKVLWWQVIQMLPSSYNQKRTITMNYENIMNMLDYRDPHRLDEWNEFCSILKTLPYIRELRDDEETS